MLRFHVVKISDSPNVQDNCLCDEKIRSIIGVTLSDNPDDPGDKIVHQIGYVAATLADGVKMGRALLELLKRVLQCGDDDTAYRDLIMHEALELIGDRSDE